MSRCSDLGFVRMPIVKWEGKSEFMVTDDCVKLMNGDRISGRDISSSTYR